MRQARTAAPDGHPPAHRGNFLSPVYLFIAGQKRWRALALAAFFGAFANLAFPPIFFWPALVISFSGLIWMLDAATLAEKPKRSAFWRVFAFGYVYFLVGMHWIAAAFLVDADVYVVFIWMPLIALPGGLALLMAAFMQIAFRFWCAGPARLILFAVFFMLSEWFRSSLVGLGGLPWNLPGMAWAPGGAISQTASIWGIYGLSALTVVALASPAALADSRARGTTGSRAAPIIVAAVVFGMMWGWGARRLSTAEEAQPAGEMVRLVEAGVGQHEKFEAGTGPKLIRRFRDLSGADGPGAPQIIIWPEGALPYYVFEYPEALDIITENLGNRKLILGLARREDADTPKERAFNSMAVLSANSNVPLALYDKHMLVPFGEFMPGGDILSAIGLKTLQNLAPGGFAAGPPPAPEKTVGVPPFGPLICYEAIFPGLSPTGLDRPRWLINISNDSWFGKLSGPYQHAAQAAYRSIEEGLPMARVAAGGLTGMIDAYGRWTARGKPADPAVYGPDPEGWTSSVVDAPIPAVAPPTPYGRWRDGLFWVILLSLNLWLLVLPRR
jgi:apolipoprotein N-acyltransferase